MVEAERVDSGATDNENDADRGPRGAGFPTLDLASAVKIIHSAGAHGADFSASAFAQYCGHSTTNSGPFRSKVAAFRDWGLATSKAGRVRLTDLGKDVARSPEPTMDQALLRRGFDACKIFRRFYDDQAKGTPLKRDTLGRVAMLDHNVAAKSQEKFVTALVDSAVTVGLASVDTEAGTVTFTSASSAADAHPPAPAAPATDTQPAASAAPVHPATAGSAAPTPAAPPSPAAPSTSAAPLLLRQAWPTATGEVVLEIRSTQPLPASAFALVGTAVGSAAALAESIGQQDAAAPAEAARPGDLADGDAP